MLQKPSEGASDKNSFPERTALPNPSDPLWCALQFNGGLSGMHKEVNYETCELR
jgi:hypothetical protein